MTRCPCVGLWGPIWGHIATHITFLGWCWVELLPDLTVGEYLWLSVRRWSYAILWIFVHFEQGCWKSVVITLWRDWGIQLSQGDHLTSSTNQVFFSGCLPCKTKTYPCLAEEFGSTEHTFCTVGTLHDLFGVVLLRRLGYPVLWVMSHWTTSWFVPSLVPV